jgi:hypothetical protein
LRRNIITVIFLFGLSIVIVAGCAGIANRFVTASYSSALVQIDRPEATKEQYGSVVTIKPEPDNKYVYEDGLFSGIFYVTNSRINFTLTNKTDHSIKIVWDEAAFIDMDGQSGRVAHAGVKYVDRNASQPPSVIPGGRSITDFVLPTERVYYREGYYGQYYSSPGGWEELPLVLPALRSIAGSDSAAVHAFASEAEANKGKRFGLLLPLEIEGVVNEYTFWFEVQDVSVTQR